MRYLLTLLLLIGSYTSQAQDPVLKSWLEKVMNEPIVTNENTETLLLDNSRSKIGRDFYDAFFRHYTELAEETKSIDTITIATPALESELNAFIVTIDELPAFGVGTTVIIVPLNDQTIWQNYVQARLDVIESSAIHAAAQVREYVINYQEIQRQLNNEDQKGSGIF